MYIYAMLLMLYSGQTNMIHKLYFPFFLLNYAFLHIIKWMKKKVLFMSKKINHSIYLL